MFPATVPGMVTGTHHFLCSSRERRIKPVPIVYLSLGSNLGDRTANLHAAIAALPDVGVCVTRISSFYETEPVDVLEQPWFLNCAVQAETDLAPLSLLRALQKIEAKMGSQKQFPKGPRLIDLDILLYASETITVPGFQVPHPRMLLRRFVLVPLSEIAPTLRHPAWNGTASELLAHVDDRSQVRRLPPEP